jgi:hemolysin activation/secretion protein
MNVMKYIHNVSRKRHTGSGMKVLYPVWVLLALSQSVFAAPLSPADRNSIEQQQQQLLLQNQQQRESLDRARWRAHLSLNSLCRRPAPCFTITRIVLDGATFIDARKQQKLSRPG